MTDTEKMRFMEMENMRLMEENVKLRRVISKLNQTLKNETAKSFHKTGTIKNRLP